MAQKLILPINNCQINAGYKSARYQKDWGFAHYGADLVEKSQKRTIYAIGEGMVVACGMDGKAPDQRMGNCIVLVYHEVQLPDGRVVSLACRMFHLARIDCKAGDVVKAGTPLGEYGNTGAHTSGAHLHIEFDTDVKYPAYAVGLSQSGNVIKRGSVDSSLNPCKVFWLGQGQSLYAPQAWINEGWMEADWLKLPSVTAAVDSTTNQRIAELETENKRQALLLTRIHELTA